MTIQEAKEILIKEIKEWKARNPLSKQVKDKIKRNKKRNVINSKTNGECTPCPFPLAAVKK
jgi:hypothetical protein